MAIGRAFFNIDMRLGAPGLGEMLKKQGIKTDKFGDGAMFMFMNRKKNQVKVLWNAQYVLSFRKSEGRISLDDLKQIPSFFRGNMFVSDKLVKQIQSNMGKSHQVSVDEIGLKVS